MNTIASFVSFSEASKYLKKKNSSSCCDNGNKENRLWKRKWHDRKWYTRCHFDNVVTNAHCAVQKRNEISPINKCWLRSAWEQKVVEIALNHMIYEENSKLIENMPNSSLPIILFCSNFIAVWKYFPLKWHSKKQCSSWMRWKVVFVNNFKKMHQKSKKYKLKHRSAEVYFLRKTVEWYFIHPFLVSSRERERFTVMHRLIMSRHSNKCIAWGVDIKLKKKPKRSSSI